jgi:hypothetical protein
MAIAEMNSLAPGQQVIKMQSVLLTFGGGVLRSTLITVLILMAGTLILGGCSQDTVQEHRAAEALLAGNPEAAQGMFHARLDFCRKVIKKSGKRIGLGTEFEMKRKSRVQAVIDFENVTPGYLYAVHMIWTKPDTKQMFRKYAEVVCEDNGEGGYVSTITWKKATDLHYVKENTFKSDRPAFSIKTHLNTSLSKARYPGEYTLMVFLHREQILEEKFILNGPEPPVEE